jgi:hypothetical protein
MLMGRFTRAVIIGGAVALLALGIASASALAPQPSQPFYFGDPDQSPGDPVADASAQLARTPNGVHASINTHDLDPGAYTAWWIIFNNPGGCVGGCGEDDVFDAGGNPRVGGPANPSVARAAGHVVGGSGVASFGGSLNEGDTSEALFGPGLVDSSVAEIHMIVRYHGPVVPELMPGMIHSLMGGCVGGDGSFECFDPQAVVFLP